MSNPLKRRGFNHLMMAYFLFFGVAPTRARQFDLWAVFFSILFRLVTGRKYHLYWNWLFSIPTRLNNLFRRWIEQTWTIGIYARIGRWRLWDQSLVTTDNFSTFLLLLWSAGQYKTSWSPGIQPRIFIFGVSRLHHCCTLPQDDQRNGRSQICVDAKTQKASTTGLRSRISECPRAFAGSAFSECHFLVLSCNSILQYIFTQLVARVKLGPWTYYEPNFTQSRV